MDIDSGIRLASGRNSQDPQNMNKFAAGSLGAVTAHRIKWILSGRSAVEQMRQWQQALQATQIMDAGPKRVCPLSAFKITETKVPGVDSPCSPLHQVRGGVSPSRGNASKTRASLPQATVEQNRRELVAFCQQCWQFTNFRHNNGEIGILPLMVKLLIDTY